MNGSRQLRPRGIRIARRIPALAVVAGALIVAAGCGGGSQENASAGTQASGGGGGGSSSPVTLRVAVSVPKNTNNGEQAARWAKDVEQATNGDVKLDVHYGDLGGDDQIVDLLRQGTLDGAFTATSTMSNMDPALGVFDLPFLFSNYKQVYAVEDGPVGKSLLDGLSSYHLVGLDFSDLGFRNFANNEHPINTPEDLSGLKMRVLQGAIPSETFKALGATPVPLDANEIYTSLQQGVVDGLDMPVPYFLTAKLYDVVKYYSISHNTFTGMVFVVTQNKWDSLSAQDQAAFKQATREAALWGRKYDRNLETTGLKELAKHGVKINNIANLEPFRQKVQPVYGSASKTIGQDVVNRAQQAIQQAGA